MRISVFGLGYVGTVSAACLARDGHAVIGVDPNPSKVELIQSGVSPVIEGGLGELVSDSVDRHRLRATADYEEGVAESDLSFLCVGTPSQPNGSLDLEHLSRVSTQIGEALRSKRARHTVVIRSTVLPGTTHNTVIPGLETASGREVGDDLGVAVNPEFLREGTALHDFDHPPKTVIGATDLETSSQVARLYERCDAPLIRVDIAVAEMVKYTDNAWHALKISFANEVGNIAKALEIDSHEVMDIFCRDEKLNLSPAYLRPGQAFGGSCLPKDVRALTYKARSLDLSVPILESILPSNRLQVDRALRMVVEKQSRKVGILGFSFKAGTDDLRESPIVEMIESLIGKGFDLRVYDRNVNLGKLVGTNREYLLNRIPHISKLMVDRIDQVLEHAETIVIGNDDPDFAGVLEDLRAGQRVVDLVRCRPKRRSDGEYDGICW